MNTTILVIAMIKLAKINFFIAFYPMN